MSIPNQAELESVLFQGRAARLSMFVAARRNKYGYLTPLADEKRIKGRGRPAKAVQAPRPLLPEPPAAPSAPKVQVGKIESPAPSAGRQAVTRVKSAPNHPDRVETEIRPPSFRRR